MDITPTWTGVLPILLSLYKKPDNREYAINEFQKMAKLADRYVEAATTQTDNAVGDGKPLLP
jgi:hypothetical protein